MNELEILKEAKRTIELYSTNKMNDGSTNGKLLFKLEELIKTKVTGRPTFGILIEKGNGPEIISWFTDHYGVNNYCLSGDGSDGDMYFLTEQGTISLAEPHDRDIEIISLKKARKRYSVS